MKSRKKMTFFKPIYNCPLIISSRFVTLLTDRVYALHIKSVLYLNQDQGFLQKPSSTFADSNNISDLVWRSISFYWGLGHAHFIFSWNFFPINLLFKNHKRKHFMSYTSWAIKTCVLSFTLVNRYNLKHRYSTSVLFVKQMNMVLN